MLVDEVKIKVSGGKGGDGRVHFDSAKFCQGPDGGNGGNGGSVFAVGVSDLAALNKFRHQKTFHAENGHNGMPRKKHGKNGEDVLLNVPAGTVINILSTGEKKEVLKVGEKIEIVSGGDGGRGNFEFRSSTNTSPEEFESGREGEDSDVFLELQLIADIGFVGFPNVGKSSMLNELTRASAKVANYKFTTLEPNLGVLDDLILADIPGLIEGASSGKGLGVKFLKHIKRTKTLIHFISSESEDVLADHAVIKKELEGYDSELAKKEEYIFLTKTDILKEEEKKEKLKILKTITENVIPVSIHDMESIEKVRLLLNKLASKA